MGRIFFDSCSVRRPLPFSTAILLAILAFTWVTTFGAGDIQQVDADAFRALIKAGDKLVRRGEFYEAEKLFRRASEMNPAHSGAKLKLAYVHVKQRRLIEAYNLSLDIA